MKISVVVLLLSIFCISPGAAQDMHKIDSLKTVLRKKGNTSAENAKTMYKLAKVYLHSDDKLTFAYADSAIHFAEKTGDTKIKAEALSLQGVVYKNAGEFQKAIEKHLGALKLKEANADTQGVAICYNDIGVLYKVMKNYTKAIKYYKQSNILCRQIGLGKGIAQTYNNIGTIFSEQKQADSAFFYYKKALAIAEEIKSNSAISTACSNIGEYYGNKGEHEQALRYFNRSLKIDEADGDVYGMIMSHINLGGVFTMQNKFADAIEHYHVAEKLCVENGEKVMLKDLYKSLANCYGRNNQKATGYEYFQKYITLYDSLQTSEINQSILDVETKYQTEKKDLEIAKNKAELETREKQVFIRNLVIISVLVLLVLLFLVGYQYTRKKQLQQKAELDAEIASQKEIRAKAIIEAEEKERIRIAKDLHDGLGQLLSAAKLNLGSLEPKLGKLDPEQESAFKNALTLMDDSVREVRTVSHNMMPNTLLKLGLASAVREFITKIQGMPALKVNLEIVGMNDRFDQEKESVLYRVIQELVANIIKHAHASQLTLQLIKQGKDLTILIEDDGVGFDTSKINSFEGIGLKNIISRVEFINGSVHFDSQPKRGTTVVIDAVVA